MSIHYQKPNYGCAKCNALFLPFKKGIKCPNCGLPVEDVDSEEYLDVIEKIASSMKVHKETHGQYFPGAWWTSDYMDNVQSLIYRIFDQMEDNNPEDEKKYLLGLLDLLDWGEQEYGKYHVKEIAREIYKVYKTKDFSESKSTKPNIIVHKYTRYSRREDRDRSQSSNIPIYYEEEAKVYIWERLTFQEKKRISVKDVCEMINIEADYISKEGEFADEGILYIKREALKKGKNYSLKDIEKVADIEYGYLEKIGAIDNFDGEDENGKWTFD